MTQSGKSVESFEPSVIDAGPVKPNAMNPTSGSPPPQRYELGLEPPGSEEVEPELAGGLLLNLARIRPCACQVARARLDTGLGRVNRVEPVLELEPEVLHEIAGVDHAQACAQADEPLIPDLLAEDRAGIQQIVIVGVRCARAGVVSGGLQLHDVQDILWNCVREKIATVANRHRRQLRLILGAAVVERDGRFSRDQVAEKIRLREWQVVRVVERQERTLERPADCYAHPDIADVCAPLPRLANRVNRTDVQRGIQIGRPEESQASTRYVEGRLDEGVDEIEPVGSADSVKRSLESELR